MTITIKRYWIHDPARTKQWLCDLRCMTPMVSNLGGDVLYSDTHIVTWYRESHEIYVREEQERPCLATTRS